MKHRRIFSFLLILCFAVLLSAGVSAAEEKSIVSPAINVVAKNSYVAKSCLASDTFTFDADDFERALNLSKVSSITITKLPDKTEGVLKLGNVEISEGQTISRANIGFMNYVFLGEGIDKSSFNFSANGEVHELECKLFSLKHKNEKPLADTKKDIEASTFKNVSLYGKVDGYDPDGDSIIYEVIKTTENGILKLDQGGEYVYKPTGNFIGKDSFKYVVVDKFGNYSSIGEVSISVDMQSSSMVFADLNGGKYHVAAISLTEKGIMPTGELGGEYYFEPDAEISRIEFLVMSMKNLGINVKVEDDTTVFSDDAQISKGYKGFVNTALEMGIVSGKIDAGGNLVFAPNDKITRAEAAVILSRMTELESPVLKPVFADEHTIPAWAESAVYSLAHVGIMENENGYVSATDTLKKGECAYMLYNLDKYVNS